MDRNHHTGRLRARLLLLGALFLLAVPVLVMLLWNAVLPPLFALPALSYLQALGLLLLTRLLVGRGPGLRRPHVARHPHCSPAAGPSSTGR